MITWYKGTRILSAGDLKILDEPRIRLKPREKGVNVQIRDVAMSDKGEFACEVNLKDRPLRITHRLEVLGKFDYLPSIILDRDAKMHSKQKKVFYAAAKSFRRLCDE